ncbi:MAG: haloacid dehalogenase type II [Armatimonadetes bacterium]|nr:haloacid dehalogenase type II [Armatimonadota bacterium]
MNVRALVFDVFGTVVDWRGTIQREGPALPGLPAAVSVDWAAFADTWRAGYAPAMEQVRTGILPWTNLDGLHRAILDAILPEFGLESVPDCAREEWVYLWHRLDPWPDAIPGLTRLRTRYIVATLSNGHLALQVALAKRAGLPWDCLFAADLFRRYKPDPEVYRGAAAWLGLPPEQILMVAAHREDLIAAGRAGLRTAFVHRPLEFGPDRVTERPPVGEFDLIVTDFPELADCLGALPTQPSNSGIVSPASR